MIFWIEAMVLLLAFSVLCFWMGYQTHIDLTEEVEEEEVKTQREINNEEVVNFWKTWRVAK